MFCILHDDDGLELYGLAPGSQLEQYLQAWGIMWLVGTWVYFTSECLFLSVCFSWSIAADIPFFFALSLVFFNAGQE